MLVILPVELKGLILCIVYKGCLILSSLILPFFHVSLSYLLIKHIILKHSAHAQFGVYC
ncbi:unnamed protein product [Staurois parvus]|uniref:Uncharacterized protein n=1 Tax=Staurois parvus TaxID=386267 RepID=A0ABN9FED8_9NEOB|nr:unnamed protein product [Staurois parvus]